jgi:hypothetical protein
MSSASIIPDVLIMARGFALPGDHAGEGHTKTGLSSKTLAFCPCPDYRQSMIFRHCRRLP